jgi:DNA mismatch repair ATPase MutS
MPPELYYNQRLQQLQQQLILLLKRKSKLGWARLFAGICFIAGIYFLWSVSAGFMIATSLILLIVFVRLIFADNENKQAIQHTKHLIQINQDELNALQHNYYHFAEGNEFIQPEHPYANDLDIFGRASLFQYINRTTSEMGSHTLAGWLSNTADADVILQRQIAVKELRTQTEWQQELGAIGKEKKIEVNTKDRLQRWLLEPNRFTKYKSLKWLRYLSPLFTFSIIDLSFFNSA